MLVMMIILYSVAPSMMMFEDKIDLKFDDAVAKFEQSVKKNNWKIPHVHDLKKSMEKFGMTGIKEVKVFELCHPKHAGKVLELDDERIVSVLMPCRIAIYEKSDGNVYVSRMNSV